MTNKYSLSVLLLITIVLGCTKEYDCDDPPIQPVFIGFDREDIDTFALIKFEANNNYQNAIDTVIVSSTDYSPYQTSNDTTKIFVSGASNSGELGIKTGYDWQIFIPSIKRTIFISDIRSEQKTGKRSYGIFSMDKVGNCTNRIFSAKMDGQIVNMSDSTGYFLFIHN